MNKEIESFYLELNEIKSRVSAYSTQTAQDELETSILNKQRTQLLNEKARELNFLTSKSQLILRDKVNRQKEPKYKRKKPKLANLVIKSTDEEDEHDLQECLLNVAVIESENQFFEYVTNQFKHYSKSQHI